MKFTNLLKSLEPYTTQREKEALLYISSLDEDLDALNYVEILTKLGIKRKKLKNLSKIQMMMLVFKLREISVGDIIELRFKCKHCKNATVGQISIPKMFRDENHPDIHKDIRVGAFSEDEIEKYIETDFNIGDLPIKEYDRLIEKYEENNKLLFNVSQDAGCVMCRKANYISLNPKDIISKGSLEDIYTNYNDLSFYSHQGFNDVSNMLPYEREVMVAMLQNTMDKE